ncbi:MAG: membrane protein insertion efficiency factor YidD [Actinobacteria bacterium]|nr:membrane protein insertion efficiency factor YidD [Actinomycetota bacterium]
MHSPSDRFAIKVALAPVHFYRRFVSPLIGPRCRYYPTCSSYALGAIRTYGVMRGSVLAAWRVLRCNPFSNGGVDHVCDQRLFGGESRKARKVECAHSHDVDAPRTAVDAETGTDVDSRIAA